MENILCTMSLSVSVMRVFKRQPFKIIIMSPLSLTTLVSSSSPLSSRCSKCFAKHRLHRVPLEGFWNLRQVLSRAFLCSLSQINSVPQLARFSNFCQVFCLIYFYANHWPLERFSTLRRVFFLTHFCAHPRRLERFSDLRQVCFRMHFYPHHNHLIQPSGNCCLINCYAHHHQVSRGEDRSATIPVEMVLLVGRKVSTRSSNSTDVALYRSRRPKPYRAQESAQVPPPPPQQQHNDTISNDFSLTITVLAT